MEKISFGVHRDSVRVFGELLHTRRLDWETANTIVENLHLEILRIRDVRRVYFDFINYKRNAYGVWVQKSRKARTDKGKEIALAHQESEIEGGKSREEE